MSIRSFLSSALILFCMVVSSPAAIVQSQNDVLSDGSAFLWVEAEQFSELGGDEDIGYLIVTKDNPIQTATLDANEDEIVKGGLDVLPADTNASGGAAIFDQLGGSINPGTNTATWELQFAIPATYYLYTHWTMYNRDTNTNYGNEDSFYVPPAFNLNSGDDWIGYEGVDTVGDPKTGDSFRDGYIDGFPVIEQNFVSAGEVEAHNSTDEDFYDGQFHWYWLSKANDMDENNNFVSFDGHGIQYEVAEADVGTVLDFEVSTREPYGVIDGFVFSTSPTLLEDFTQEQMDEFFLNRGLVGDFDNSGALDVPDVNMLNAAIASGGNDPTFDLTGDGSVTEDDLNNWVRDQRVTTFGDANLDSEFNSSDLVGVFQAGKYELDVDATWDEGDWTGDLRFGSGDLVKAFQAGDYEQGPIGGGAVPEPSGLILCLIGGLILMRRSHS